MHTSAVSMSRKPKTRNNIFRATPISRALALFNLAYVIAKEELPFTKYPALVEVENRHGVAIGNTYTTEHKCREFICIIGETMRDDILASLKQA